MGVLGLASRRWLVVLCVAMVAGLGLPWPAAPTAAAAPDAVYFPETGHHVEGPFLTTWRLRGGLAIFGYPISEPLDRDGLRVQYFERARFELHPELAGTPYEVELTLLGSRLTADRTDPPFARLDFGIPPQTGTDRAYYPETGHFLAYGFKAYWEANGGLYAFGYPISEEFAEPNPDTGETYTVQYFERARFEWHPEERDTPYEVLLGRLGAQAVTRDGIDTAAVPRRDGVPDYAPGLFVTGLRIPVLMYHNIGPAEGRYEIPLWKFEQQLDWLRDNGYTTVTISQVFDYMEGTGVLPERPVVLTFDDAYASQWDAAAALDARGMHGVFFITAAASRLSDWQIRAMADRGHEIGSHSLGHPDLTTVSAGQLYSEVGGSKAVLEGIIGRPVLFFAYPYGAYDGRAIDAVASSGYRGGVAAWGGQNWSPDKRWVEPRIEVSGVLSIWEFAGLVQ